jgi:hypothetical protein
MAILTFDKADFNFDEIEHYQKVFSLRDEIPEGTITFKNIKARALSNFFGFLPYEHFPYEHDKVTNTYTLLGYIYYQLSNNEGATWLSWDGSEWSTPLSQNAHILGTLSEPFDFPSDKTFSLAIDGKDQVDVLMLAGSHNISTVVGWINTALDAAYGASYNSVASVHDNKILLTSPTGDETSAIEVIDSDALSIIGFTQNYYTRNSHWSSFQEVDENSAEFKFQKTKDRQLSIRARLVRAAEDIAAPSLGGITVYVDFDYDSYVDGYESIQDYFEKNVQISLEAAFKISSSGQNDGSLETDFTVIDDPEKFEVYNQTQDPGLTENLFDGYDANNKIVSFIGNHVENEVILIRFKATAPVEIETADKEIIKFESPSFTLVVPRCQENNDVSPYYMWEVSFWRRKARRILSYEYLDFSPIDIYCVSDNGLNTLHMANAINKSAFKNGRNAIVSLDTSYKMSITDFTPFDKMPVTENQVSAMGAKFIVRFKKWEKGDYDEVNTLNEVTLLGNIGKYTESAMSKISLDLLQNTHIN